MSEEGESTQENRPSLGKSLLKYFEQGFLFSLIVLGLTVVWAVALVLLVLTGFIIGLIIGFVILLLMLGWLNAVLTNWIWKIPIEMGLVNLFGHGFVLFIALLIVRIPAIITNLAVPSTVTTVAVFLVYCFVDGFVAKNVGGFFRDNDLSVDDQTAAEEYRDL
jgi:hypothetical protein